MKILKLTSILLILLLGIASKNVFSQDCLNFNNMNAPIADYNNDSINPAGSVLLNTGDLNLIKTKNTNGATTFWGLTNIIYVNSTDIGFNGYLTFDVSSASYSCRELVFTGLADKIIIGNDTISSITFGIFAPYTGNGYSIDTLSNNTIKIKGNFNAVSIWAATGIVYDACLSNCATNSGCLDFRNLIGTSWPGNTGYNDDVLYPAGSIILSEGGVKIVKPYTAGNWNPPYNTIFTASTDTTLLLSGNIILDVSASTYGCKKLTFTTMWGPTVLIVDGDTIPNPSTSYSGNGYNISVSNSSYTVTGSFNSITLYSPNLGIADICLDSCVTNNTGCIDFRDLIGTSWPGNTGYNDDVLYPAGSTILSAGDVKIVKTHPYGNWNPPLVTYFAFATDTTIAGDGYMTIDVSSSNYSCKELSFSTIANTLIINGDTINNFGANSSYSGVGYNIVLTTSFYKDVVVTGSFNSVILAGSNLTIGNVCLNSCTTNNTGCLDFNNMTSSVGDYNNDSIYPIGSILLNSGYLNLIKTKTGSWAAPGYFEQTTFNNISSTQLFHHGYLTFDVSSATYSCKELSIKGMAEKIIIGNDTISTTPGFNPYNGNGFVVDTLVGGGYFISGNFNEVTIWIPTGLLNGACIDSCRTNNTGCIDFRDLIGTSWPGGTGYNDDILYPAGSTILSAGDVKIVKTHPYGNWNPPLVTYFAFATDTTIAGDGYMTIDVSSSNYSCKELSFSTIANTLIINGDTIINFGANSSYSGVGYNIVLTTSFYKDVVVTGSFNSVILAGSNLTIGNVCLDSCVTPIPCNNYAGFTFTITPNRVLFINTSSSTSTSAQQFQWDFGDGNFSGDNDPTHNYAAPGNYYVCLTIVDFSCPINPTFQFCDTVIIGGCPNGHRIITPNNDGEADDVFVPSGSKIYDRNGFMVKDVKQDVNWKGTDDANESLPMGYYTITCGNGDGVFNVTIVR